jgi:acetyltransferase-like isoleucine patch superfamily enzyme
MAFLTLEELGKLNFKYIGENVKISDKSSIYGAENISIDNNVIISDYTVISGKVTIGRNVYISVHCLLQGGNQGITISSFASISSGVHIFAESDDQSGQYLTNPTIPSEYKNTIGKSVFIGNHAIIGSQSIIYPGVLIGDGASISAKSMQTTNAKEWSVYFGIPSEKIKDRNKDLLVLEKKYLESINQ